MRDHPRLRRSVGPGGVLPGGHGTPRPPESDAEFAGLERDGGIVIGFQRVDGYRAPSWPDQAVPQQLHLDFAVDDLDEAEARLLELGARKPDHQPREDQWRVLTDPAGHPFCLCRA